MQPARYRSRIQNDIQRIQPGGGTEIFSSLDMAYRDLSVVQARKKHVILLTDGQAPSQGIKDLVQAMLSESIHRHHRGLGVKGRTKICCDQSRTRRRPLSCCPRSQQPAQDLHPGDRAHRPAGSGRGLVSGRASGARRLPEGHRDQRRAVAPRLRRDATQAGARPTHFAERARGSDFGALASGPRVVSGMDQRREEQLVDSIGFAGQASPNSGASSCAST